MSATEFVGVTKDKRRGVASKGGLYEFWTEDSCHVYLHDTDFRRLAYQPGRPSVLEFVEDLQIAQPGPSVVVFRFENVRIVEWCEDQESHDYVAASPEAAPGQVELFDWDGTDLFYL